MTWKLVYSESFTRPAALGKVGAVYGKLMRGYDGFGDTSQKGRYAPDKVLSVVDGHLDFRLHTENGQPLVAAPIPQGWVSQTYGRYEVRYRHDPMPGFKIAFLLWPDSNNWDEGEIDWPEHDLDAGAKASPASAVPGSLSPQWSMTFEPPQRIYAPTDAVQWHTAVTEWTPGLVRWLWDGREVGRTTKAVPTKPMHWVLQAETSIGGPKPAAGVSGHLQVDYLKVYGWWRA